MSAQRGLADRKEYEAFCLSWYDAVLEETKRWCRKEEIQKLLAEAVMTDCRGQYADRVPPNDPEFNLRAQVCLIYSLTGANREKLEDYLALHRFREKSESQPSGPEEGKIIKDGDDSQRPDREQSVTEAEENAAELVPDEAKQRDKASASEPEGTEGSVREEKQVKNPAPPEERSTETSGVPSAQNPAPPEERSTETSGVPSAQMLEPNNLQHDQREATGQSTEERVDTFIDPVRTTLWTPNSDRVYHRIQEMEIPDAEEEERSVGLSFFNTILFLLVLASSGFFVYEIGIIQYLIASVR